MFINKISILVLSTLALGQATVVSALNDTEAANAPTVALSLIGEWTCSTSFADPDYRVTSRLSFSEEKYSATAEHFYRGKSIFSESYDREYSYDAELGILYLSHQISDGESTARESIGYDVEFTNSNSFFIQKERDLQNCTR
jgi:hypothetical protein